jgi:hypothetical protein
MTTSLRHFLRRKALIECRGLSQKTQVVDFSTAGLRIDGVSGLATGDHVWIAFAPDLSVEGKIAWSVWHKAGVRLSRPLAESDPVYIYLADQAAALEQLRLRAIVELAKERTSRAKRRDVT